MVFFFYLFSLNFHLEFNLWIYSPCEFVCSLWAYFWLNYFLLLNLFFTTVWLNNHNSITFVEHLNTQKNASIFDKITLCCLSFCFTINTIRYTSFFTVNININNRSWLDFRCIFLCFSSIYSYLSIRTVKPDWWIESCIPTIICLQLSSNTNINIRIMTIPFTKSNYKFV